MYVDDLFFCDMYEAKIHDVAKNLCKFGVDLWQEDDAECFLVVSRKINGDSGLLEIKQTV